jgi:hypothetical protein
LEAEYDDGGQQCVDTTVPETQCWSSLAIDLDRSSDLFKDLLPDDGVVLKTFSVEETPVGGEADLPQLWEVVQPSADAEIAAVIDRGLGTEGAALLVILLNVGVLVLDVE